MICRRQTCLSPSPFPGLWQYSEAIIPPEVLSLQFSTGGVGRGRAAAADGTPLLLLLAFPGKNAKRVEKLPGPGYLRVMQTLSPPRTQGSSETQAAVTTSCAANTPSDSA